MRLLFITLAGFFAIQVQAQELTKVVDFKNQRQEKEEYYVLKKDTKTRHGNYKRIDTFSKYVLEEGFYKNNVKDSLWTEYLRGTPHKMKEGYYVRDKKAGVWRECTFADNTIFLSDKGAYKEDVRAGPWQFFNKEGETLEVYDFSRDTLLYAKAPADTAEFDVLIDNTWQKRKLERTPGIIRDKYGKHLINAVSRELNYPIQAARDGAEGTVVIGFSINEEGKAGNFHVHEKLHPLLDAEALRAAKLINFKFYPALLNGKPVTAKMLFPIRFTITLADGR